MHGRAICEKLLLAVSFVFLIFKMAKYVCVDSFSFDFWIIVLRKIIYSYSKNLRFGELMKKNEREKGLLKQKKTKPTYITHKHTHSLARTHFSSHYFQRFLDEFK